MRISFTLLFIMLCFLSARAQPGRARYNDSLKQAKKEALYLKLQADSAWTYRYKKYRPYIHLDNRNSFINDRPVNVQGLQLGVRYKGSHVFSLGFYTITEGTKKPRKPVNNEGHANAAGSLTLRYTTFAYQYVLLDRRYIQIDLPFEIGYGGYNLKVQDLDTKKYFRDKTAPIVPFGAGVLVVLKPVRSVGLAAMSGYRYVSEKEEELNFNGMYYAVGIWIDLRQIYRNVKYKGFIKHRYKKRLKAIENGA